MSDATPMQMPFCYRGMGDMGGLHNFSPEVATRGVLTTPIQVDCIKLVFHFVNKTLIFVFKKRGLWSAVLEQHDPDIACI